MIALEEFDYKDHYDLDYRITEYVNSNLYDMICFVYELKEDYCKCDGVTPADAFDEIAPTYMIRNKPDECLHILEDLCTMIDSSAIRWHLAPVYQYFLFHSLVFCIDFDRDTSFHSESPMDELLKADIIAVYGEGRLAEILDASTYPDWIFLDWDFLSDQLTECAEAAMANPAVFLSLSRQVNLIEAYEWLDSYVDLMDIDIRDRYLAFRSKYIDPISFVLSESPAITLSGRIYSALLSVQRNPIYRGRSENEITDGLRDILSSNYEVHDQTRQGISESGLSAGEADLVVYLDGKPFSLIEALKLFSLNKDYLDSHIRKALDNYNPNGLSSIHLLIYASVADLSAFWSKFSEYMQQYQFPYKVVGQFCEIKTDYSESRRGLVILNRNDTEVMLHICVINIK